MQSTGIVRRIDELGRIVIPRAIRKSINIHDGDALEIYVDNKERIVSLKKYEPTIFYNDAINILSDITEDALYNELSHTEKQALLDVIGKLYKKLNEE